MFKNITLFRCEGLMPSSAAALDLGMVAAPFVACGPTQQASKGWVSPRAGHGSFVESIGGQWIVKLQIEQRSVPAAVVKRETDKRAAKIEKDTGRKPRGRVLKDLKEEVILELLPRAFSKISTVLAWINPETRIIAVDTSSHSKAVALVAGLIEASPDMNVHELATTTHAENAMAVWLASDEPPPDFTIDREGELRGHDGEKPKVSFKSLPLDTDEVRDRLAQGMSPTRLAMTYAARVSFVLTEALQIKRINFLDVCFGDSTEGVDQFDADAALMTGELGNLLAALIDGLGGVRVPPIIAAQDDATGTTGQPEGAAPAPHHGDGPDPLYEQACAVVRTNKRASISLVQRHLRVGYNRAARLLETMEEDGLVTAMGSNGSRELVAGDGQPVAA